MPKMHEISDTQRSEKPNTQQALLGIDIGSTTTKAVVVDAATHETLHSTYRRHHAHQTESLRPILTEIAERFPDLRFSVAMSGSGGKAIAEYLGIPYAQEVVANAIAVQEDYPQARCAIELGGQDAKMIFFEADPETGQLNVADMRMNGSCAGGTGAFIDEIATLLKTPVEQLDSLAAQGTTAHSISGRCGVYAKTDIQPLLNQGARKEDIALSTFHAIAKQTLGGLAQGLDVNPPVIFEGGPLTFNPTLVRVFAERLGFSGDQIIVPENPEVIVARGAALALTGLLADERHEFDLQALVDALAGAPAALASQATSGEPFFVTEAELTAFKQRHALPPAPHLQPRSGQVVRAYLGIDSGSTTTKFALIDEDENVIESFYSSNEGEPLDIARDALTSLNGRVKAAGARLDILGVGTTGYGEALFARAFHADTHMVETVAHEAAAAKYAPDVSFILDIGGQDMKAIWVDGGVVTDILVNEACSSGCGSFLETFAKSLDVPVRGIADAAFHSQNPAVLGSRCTVFMNSSVVTEQKNGKMPDDIMAGLCRSIIENVFTKVIRVSNIDALGDKIVVQGGTFNNDAVLAAFEQYVGKEVTRAPYPGLMGAIGAALLAKQHMEEAAAAAEAAGNSVAEAGAVETGAAAASGTHASTFIGLDALDGFTYTQESNVTCPFCGNACSRTIVTFPDGTSSVTGNRCERGQVVGDPHDASVRAQLREAAGASAATKAENLFDLRQKLVFADYEIDDDVPARGETIGMPRVLGMWDRAPFWTTLFRQLGFDVVLSDFSSQEMYEDGLSAVTSDTVCFPAKLVHGHIRNLAKKQVNRIFMPTLTTVKSENTAKTSESMCAVVKGYSLVIQNSDNPQDRFGITFDNPLFHWYSDADCEKQLTAYLHDTFDVAEPAAHRAIERARAAMDSFHEQLLSAGQRIVDEALANNTYAVVLGSRPYHNDPLVNHDLPELFASQGIAVMPPDALPGANEVDLSNSRIDIVNNFHARMLGGAVLAAQSDNLEFVQLVSFGCGHDAYLSDEIIRMMHEVGGKTPLVLKVDESDAAGPLRIRVRSFIETVRMRRKQEGRREIHALPDPYPQKFTRADKRRRVVLVPNTSHAFSRLMAAVFARQGLETVALPIGREEAIRLGKKYVHNDICFPAQIVIGEALAELESGKYDDAEVAVGTGKYVGDCRLTHYAALLRKALDDSGHADVPIITNDDADAHDMQPGFKMNIASAITCAMALPMIDVLEELLRKMRPYELVPGTANEAFERALDQVIEGIERSGARGAKTGFKRAIEIMSQVEYDRSNPRPTVLIVGEYLLNFHPGANHDIEDYLERNGFEIIEARMTDVIRKTYFYKDAQVREFDVGFPLQEKAWYRIANQLFDIAHNVTDGIACAHPLYKPAARMDQIVQASDPIIHHTFDAGEGVLIPAEIIHHAEEGCRAFVILQPFGCLPNHVVGRGIAKRLKAMYPQAQILPLDYDPDVSFANVENRLQMLIMSARGQSMEEDAGVTAPAAATSPTTITAPSASSQPELASELSACAVSLADIAREASSIAAHVQEIVNSEMPAEDRVAESYAGMTENLPAMKTLEKRIQETAKYADELLERAKASARKQADDATQQLADAAWQVCDLANNARLFIAELDRNATWRIDAVRSMVEEDAIDEQLLDKMIRDARTDIHNVTHETKNLLAQANCILVDVDEHEVSASR
jgi:predicted CoA-substrate-specific enzyme activase